MNGVLTNLLADFHERLNVISNINGVNQELIKIFTNDLRDLQKIAPKNHKLLQEKIGAQLKIIGQVKYLPEMLPKFEIIREQAVVLMIGALEVFVTDVFKGIANNNPSFFKWPEKDKKIAIDIETFRTNFTLGDAFVTHLNNKQYSFQDLGSIIKAVEDYLGVHFEVDQQTKEYVVIGTAYRHLIVHNGGIVDRQFLNQTREISSLQYNEGDCIKIADKDVDGVRDALVSFSEILINITLQRDD